MSKKKLFPIHTATACPLKWNWSTVFFQSGTSSSCHRNKKLPIPTDNFESFHNLAKKLEDRERMLKGLWPKNACEYCSVVEKNGGYSDRMNQLSQLSDPSNVPPELAQNPMATKVTPTFIEVYFRNTCNMACVYCGPHYSSKWEEELKSHGPIQALQEKKAKFSVQKAQVNTDYDKHKKQFWDYLSSGDRYKSIRWFSFLGGEPLVIPELDECLDFWDSHPNDKLTFQVVTNLKANEARFTKFIDKIKRMSEQKKVYKFKIIASIDCFGPETEYVRHGMNLHKWTENFQSVLSLKNVDVGINVAVSSLTLPTFPRLLDKINEWNHPRSKNDRIILSFNIDTSLTSPTVLGGDFFKETFKQCDEKMPVNTLRDISVKKHWKSLEKEILKSKFDKEKVESLKDYLAILDSRRNTDWKKTFPWLVDL